jgi:SAM-dependent methyltransferase
MKKIYTIRDAAQQQNHLWDNHMIVDEVAACPGRNIVGYFLRYLPKDEPILEAGCGLGAWVIYLGQRGYRIAGVDNNRKVINSLKQWDPDLNVISGDIEHLPYDNDSLGAYISLGVVEHFEEGPEKPLQEAFRVLKPGGMIFLTVPANNLFRQLIAHPLRRLFLLYHALNGRRKHFAEYRYSPAEVRQMIAKAGFLIQETGNDDFISKTRSMTLWSEFPFLRGKGPYGLNIIGKSFAWIINSISRKILSAGVLVIAQKGK